MGRSSKREEEARQVFLGLRLVLEKISAPALCHYALIVFEKLNTINESMLKIRGKEEDVQQELLDAHSSCIEISQLLSDYLDPYKEVKFCPSWGALKEDYWHICFATYYPSSDAVDKSVDLANIQKMFDGYQTILKDFAGFIEILKDPTTELVQSALSNFRISIKSYQEILEGILSRESALQES